MFQILSAHGTDAKVWDSYVEMLPYDLRDVHFTSGWGRAQEAAIPRAMAHMAALRDDDRGEVTMQTFLMRPIPDSRHLYDVGAAGYGGIVTSSALPSGDHGQRFEREMAQWRREQQVICEFALINPAFAGHQMALAIGAGATLRPVKDVIVLHVGPDEEFRSAMRATRRHAHDKGARANVRPVPVTEFLGIYSRAMERKEAAPRWRLGLPYFQEIANLGDDADCFAVHSSDGTMGAAGVFLFGRSVAYYHLAATVDKPEPGLADVIVGAGVQEANARGCDWLHLGGGVTSAKDDSLLAYKRSFGGLQRVVYGVHRVFDDAAYRLLCDGAPTGPNDFFPAYRAKEAQAA